MNRLAVACVLAACGVPATPTADPEPRRMPEEVGAHVHVATTVESPPRSLYQAVHAAEPPPTHVVTATPSNIMDALALTADGKIAVSVDRTGAMRLWPTLDGRHEPVVIPARAATRLAIGREGDEVVIAGLDPVGQLELVHATALGLEVERIAVDAVRPLVDVRVAGSRVIAVRDDQVIVAFDTHGAVVGELALDPGERVASIEVQHDRALAVVYAGTHVRGRWLDLGTTIAWGASTPPLAIDPKRDVALAPDGKRLAAVTRDGRKIVILDLATAKVVRSTASFKPEDGVPLAPIGFLDDHTLAEAAPFQLMIWRDGTTEVVDGAGAARAAAGGRLVADSSGTLMIADESGTHYLGYAMPTLSDLIARKDGLLAIDANTVVRLDRKLHVDRVYELPEQILGAWHTLQLLDDHRVLAYSNNGGFIVDLDSTEEPIQMPIGGAVAEYRRSTHVIVMRTGTAYLVARFDGDRGTFTTPVEVMMRPTFGSTITLLDPGHGAVAVVVESIDGARQIQLTDIRLADGEVVLGRTRSALLDHSFWEDQDQIQKLIHAVPQTTMRSPDGDLIATLDAQALTLRTKHGEKWSRRVVADSMLWTTRGELFVWGGGLGRLDLETGVFAERQCGWQFGLYDRPMNTVTSPGLCDARE